MVMLRCFSDISECTVIVGVLKRIETTEIIFAPTRPVDTLRVGISWDHKFLYHNNLIRRGGTG